MADKKKELLKYAAQQLGRSELAARLKVSQSTLDAWLEGSADMTHNKALALADLIHELSKAQK
jgi:DNA-binding transcriptional regulator YiaG